MAIMSRDLLPFFRKSLPVNDFLQTSSRYNKPAGISYAESPTVYKIFPFDATLRYRTLSCCNVRRRGKQNRDDIFTTCDRYPVSLSSISMLHEVLAIFGSGESPLLLLNASNASASGKKGGFSKEEVRTEFAAGSKDFAAKGLAPVTRARRVDDVESKNAVEKAKLKGREAGRRSIGSEGTEKPVEVEVEVVSWRERHIKANVCVEASHQTMWEVLTDYERLPDFVPNLVRSERITSPTPGRIWLLQQGVHSAMYWHIEARVVLDLEELPHAVNGKELRFSMVDGDFKHYRGRWYLRPGPRSGMILLHFEVSFIPKLIFPAAFVERIIRADLPVNLRALAGRAETDASEWMNTMQSSELPFGEQAPLPFQAALSDKRWTAQTKFKLARPCSVDEVHVRRLDDFREDGGVHRRVVAAMTVESPIRDVWNVLTDYECLPEFIPNLASSKVISRESNRVRLEQEGCKCILYMVLHACVVLDLWEKPEGEIIFQQVKGDFHSFQGKWTLERLGSEHTLLKYVVDIKMEDRCLLAETIIEEVIYVDLPANLCAIRDRVELRKREPVPGQDPAVPEVSTESEDERATLEPSSITYMHPKVGRKRFRVAGLQKDFGVLEKELFVFIQEHGRQGYMPMRSELREHKRLDLEKAIGRMGGFGIVATRLNLSQQRRPRGYWDNFQNLCHEILIFQKECGMDCNYMPTRNSLNKAGRPDVARALEKWGGVQEVARLMNLRVRRVRHGHAMKIMSSNSSSTANDDSISPKPFKIALPAKPTKWIDIKQDVNMES